MTKVSIDRRHFISSLAAGSMALTGCLGDDDDGGDPDDDLGERVPTIVLGTQPGFEQETMIELVSEHWEDRLGIDTDPRVEETAVWAGNMLGDERVYHFSVVSMVSSPDRLIPESITTASAIQNAGNTGSLFPVGHYASCEYSEPANQLAETFDEDSRRELVNEAESIISHDVARIVLAPYFVISAYRTDLIDLQGLGTSGLQIPNHEVFIESTPLEDDAISINIMPEHISDRNYATISGVYSATYWTNMIHSPLVEYTSDFELENVLASSVESEVVDGNEVYTVELEEATFTNGDPITAEDVKYTFDLVFSHGVPRKPGGVPFDSSEVIDESTVQFTFTRNYPQFHTVLMPSWGVLHKDTWEEQNAMEDIDNFQFDPDNVVASGPFEVDLWNPGEVFVFVPRDDHPKYRPNAEVIFQAFSDIQSAFLSFQGGELQLLENVLGGPDRDIIEMDNAELETAGGLFPFAAMPTYPMLPTKFLEFRQACAAAIDYREIADLTFFDLVEPELKSCFYQRGHPWRPDEDVLYTQAEDESGSEEDARSFLSDAGWGWDDDGNLRYPVDADLTPLWPATETPSPDDFPCLSGE